MTEPQVRLEDSESRTVVVPRTLKEVNIVCVVADHYPALSFQAREFLKYASEGVIRPPFVIDVFAMDVITEMLQSPLRFLSYVSRRVSYADKVLASHELIVLAYHLKKNLWVDDELTMVCLDDDISADLDIAMAARRDGVPGARTPEGILTRLASTSVGRIIEQIEADPSPATIELGFLLLILSEEALQNLSKGIDWVAQLAAQDHQSHDLTIDLAKLASGLTVHCNDEPTTVAGPQLHGHCVLRK